MVSEKQIISLLESIFSTKGIDKDTRLETFVKDSMDVVEFFSVLKKRYDIEIDASEVSKAATVGDLLQIIQHDK